jgi:hypothetical protein
MSQHHSILEKRQKALGDIQTKLNDIDSSFRHLFHENEMKIDYETRTTKAEVSFHSISVISLIKFVFTIQMDQKLQEIHHHLTRVYYQTCKDDKLTKLIKTFLTAL